MRFVLLLTATLTTMGIALAAEAPASLPVAVGTYQQEFHRAFTTEQGLPDNDVTRVGIDAQGKPVAQTAKGTAQCDGEQWQPAALSSGVIPSRNQLDEAQVASLRNAADGTIEIRATATRNGEIAVASDKGLYLGDGTSWRLALPQQGAVRWAPVDVRAVAYDASGRLWFAAPQGVGCRVSKADWLLFTGVDGLPYNDFTCMAAGPDSVWFGTTNGAIHYRDGLWEFRQGRRWLLDNHVRDVTVDADGNAWFATAAGVSCIARKPMTLAEKAAFYQDEIEKYHRRTRYGYVDPAEMSKPGDKSTATPVFTDNDGHFTGLYLGAVSFGYAVTGNEKMKRDAANAFRALAFLSEVTQGGSHPAPKGFIARAVKPTSEPDPNPQFDLAYDQRRQKADSLWKIIQPRWPVDATGEWYWKNDSSSDELDGHFFGYAAYFDNVCKTEAEKDAVREVVRRIMNHIIDHGYNLVDHDGKPTRWAHFSPDDMNRNEYWYGERGLDSLSILTYLTIAHHVTGDVKYREALLHLAIDEGYAMNGMNNPKFVPVPEGPWHQPDDNMSFMNYYHLVRYEKDPKLLSMFQQAIRTHWLYEKRERNPFFNFIYAACCNGKVRKDNWGEIDLTMPARNYEDSIDTLKRYPLDLVDWPMSNAHRLDMLPFLDETGAPTSSGRRRDGEVFPIDERHEIYWDLNPWALSYDGNGTRLREGVPFMLAYYLGRVHGLIGE
ncbi:MAG: hypothetical protein K1Y02_25075 [Candidatus Hydrogenedentes bacterium]|nr:hypothetical protein [Candidatus Hydrogenedentota bacterium]